MDTDLLHHACPHCGQAFPINEIPFEKLAAYFGAKGGSASGATKIRHLSSEKAREMRRRAPRNTRAGKPAESVT